MSRNVVRIGTRGSALARVQAQLVADALRRVGVQPRIVVVETAGDRRAPDTAWGEGAFVGAIETALLRDEVDVAVHSAKDIPTDEDPRLSIAAFLPRADARDALVTRPTSGVRTLADLPHGARIGTDSPRRSAFLRARRPDLDVRPLHGNVDTRLRRLDEGEADALILAVAGLARLGRGNRVTEILDPATLPPAPGQGAIAIQVRADDAAARQAAGLLDDRPTRLAVEAERSFLRASGGGCRAPVGALATTGPDGTVTLLGAVAGAAGVTAFAEVRATSTTDPSIRELAATLRARMPSPPMVLVTRPRHQAGELVDRLRDEGLEPVVVPAIAVHPPAAAEALDAALSRLAEMSWAVVTSANGASAVVHGAARLGASLDTVRWAAVGGETAAVLAAAGVEHVWQPPTASAQSLGQSLPVHAGDRVLLLQGSLAADDLRAVLADRGATTVAVQAYTTVVAPPDSRPLLADVLGMDVAAITFASGSAVSGLLELADGAHLAKLLGLPAVCLGPETAAMARAAGFRTVHLAADRSAAALARATTRALESRIEVPA